MCGAVIQAIRGGARRGLLMLCRLYQSAVSPLMRPRCRFSPTCSAYAKTALQQHSLPKAIGLIVWRLLRCHPWGACGADPVPEKKSPPLFTDTNQ